MVYIIIYYKVGIIADLFDIKKRLRRMLISSMSSDNAVIEFRKQHKEKDYAIYDIKRIR